MKIFYILVIIFVVGLVVLGISRTPKESDNRPEEVPAADSSSALEFLETKTNDEGGVTVVITPKNLSGDLWDFEVSLSTHSVELSEDITEVAVLVDESGKEHQPISWEGDAPGGHHRQGILKFESITPKPKTVKLIIRQVGGIKERFFSWQTSQ